LIHCRALSVQLHRLVLLRYGFACLTSSLPRTQTDLNAIAPHLISNHLKSFTSSLTTKHQRSFTLLLRCFFQHTSSNEAVNQPNFLHHTPFSRSLRRKIFPWILLWTQHLTLKVFISRRIIYHDGHALSRT
jgi:hypothetical protein